MARTLEACHFDAEAILQTSMRKLTANTSEISKEENRRQLETDCRKEPTSGEHGVGNPQDGFQRSAEFAYLSSDIGLLSKLAFAQ